MSDSGASSDSSDAGGGGLPQQMVFALQLLYGQAVGESILEGIFVLLAGMAIYTLAAKGLQDATRTATILNLVAIGLMLVLSILMWACDFTLGLLIFTEIGPNPTPGIRLSEMVAVGRVCSRLIFLIGDLIVASRAWLLAQNPVVRACLATSVIATIACDIVEIVLAVRTSFTNDEGQEDPIFTLIRGVPLLFTNVLATGIISYRTWTYRRHIKIYLQGQDRRNRVERILLLLVESGVLYCFLWVLSIIFDTAFDTFAPQSQIVGSIIPYIAGIYPTAMIVLVSGAKADENFATNETADRPANKSSLRFAPPPAHAHSTAHTHSILQSMADHLYHPRIRHRHPDRDNHKSGMTASDSIPTEVSRDEKDKKSVVETSARNLEEARVSASSGDVSDTTQS